MSAPSTGNSWTFAFRGGVTPFTIAQAAAAVVALARLSRGRGRRPPLAAAAAPPPAGRVSVVIPARDEAERIGPLLASVTAVPDVAEVLVVDDQSSDATAEVSRAAGAVVVAGREPPAGWVGKPWALQQGLEAARGEIVVCLDADTRPAPGLVRALAAELERDTDLVTGGVRFVCEGVAERLLHPALLATLIYRYGPVGTDADSSAGGGTDAGTSPAGRRARSAAKRVLANGQCLAFRREAMLAAGGFASAAGHLTDDVAHARALVAAGWRLRFVDCADLIEVRMYDGARDTWHGWGRSIALADVTPPLERAVDIAVVWLALALPLPRILARRASPLDYLLAAVRLSLVVPLARVYRPRGLPYALSPLADVPAAVRLTLSALRPSQTWRGRTYSSGSAGRSGT